MARNQKELAAALGMSEGQVSKLKRRGMPTDSIEAARAWRSRNVNGYVRTDAEPAPPPPPSADLPGRDSAGQLNLGQERAALARAQRMLVESRLAVQSGEYAPIKLLAQVLATASQAVAERFDHLPGHLRKTCPEMSDRQRDEVVSVISAARNEWIRTTAELVTTVLTEQDDEPAGDEAEANPTTDTEATP